MNQTERNSALAALRGVSIPGLGTNPVDGRMVRSIERLSDTIELKLHLSSALVPHSGIIETACIRALSSKFEGDIRVLFETIGDGQPLSDQTAKSLSAPGLASARVVAVYSAKGGVGKSSVAVNLAAEAAAAGLRTGLLDADLYGPSIPLLMGIDKLPEPSGHIAPAWAWGVTCMSIGFLVKPGDSMVWRGPVLHQLVQRLFSDVAWPELDLLVVDLPPGTGDVLLSLSKTVRLSGAVGVTTPQPVATSDIARGISALGKLGVPVLGLVENMAGPVFGRGGGEELALGAGFPFLGRIELRSEIREAGDAGMPISRFAPGSAAAAEVQSIFSAFEARIASGVGMV